MEQIKKTLEEYNNGSCRIKDIDELFNKIR